MVFHLFHSAEKVFRARFELFDGVCSVEASRQMLKGRFFATRLKKDFLLCSLKAGRGEGMWWHQVNGWHRPRDAILAVTPRSTSNFGENFLRQFFSLSLNSKSFELHLASLCFKYLSLDPLKKGGEPNKWWCENAKRKR